MAPNTAAEEAAPLLDEKVGLESDAAVKGPEVQVDSKAVASSGRKVTDFLSNRSTYYCKSPIPISVDIRSTLTPPQ